MLLGTGSHSTGFALPIIDCTICRQPGMETNARSARRADGDRTETRPRETSPKSNRAGATAATDKTGRSPLSSRTRAVRIGRADAAAPVGDPARARACAARAARIDPAVVARSRRDRRTPADRLEAPTLRRDRQPPRV